MSDLELSRTIREQGEGQLRSRQGKIVSIQTGPPRTLTVAIGGQNIAGVRVMDHVDPVVDEGVWLLDMGNGRWLCYGTNSSSQTRSRYVKAAGDTMSGNLTLAVSENTLTVGTGLSQRSHIEFLNSLGAGVNPPTITADATIGSGKSAGTKIVLYPNYNGSTLADYAIGIEGFHIWFGVPGNTGGYGFKWYGGATQWMSLNNGNLSVTSGTITGGSTVQGTRLISTIATGTAPLTVTSTTKVANLNASFLEGKSAPDNVWTTSFTTRTTSAAAITAAMATLVLPAQVTAGTWFYTLKVILTNTIAGDAFDVGVSADGGTSYIALTRVKQDSGVSVHVHGILLAAAGVGDTITAHMNRQAGSGTGTVAGGDSRFFVLMAHFVPS